MAKKWEEKKDEFEKIQLIPEAAEEYNNLDGSIKIEVDKKFIKLDKNPFLGVPLVFHLLNKSTVFESYDIMPIAKYGRTFYGQKTIGNRID